MRNWWDRRSNAFRVTAIFLPLFLFATLVFSALASYSQHIRLSAAPMRSTLASEGPLSSQSPDALSLTATPTTTPSPTPTARPTASGDAITFVSLLAEIREDDSPSQHSGYDRDLFNVWIDANSDGCNTRAEVLKSETTSPVEFHGVCTIDTGSWYSPYDGVWLTDAGSVDIDHFVPLSEAWVSGAWQWTSATRTAFGNDLGYAASLIAVSDSSNRSKSDQDPARWLPTNTSYYCDYVATWIAVKWRWDLTVDSVERSTLSSILSECSTLAVIVPERAPVVLDPNAISGRPSVGGGGSGDGIVDPDFGTCKVAKANGYGPYISGVDPEYNFYRDADNDGRVCE